MKKDIVFNWSDECDAVFQCLKDMLATLSFPCFGADQEFSLETDASSLGLGAVLSQM